MIIIALLLSVSLVIAAFFLGAYIWAVKNGQYDDTETPAMRVFNEGLIRRKKADNQGIANNKPVEKISLSATAKAQKK